MQHVRQSSFRRLVASVAILCLVGMTVAPSFAHRASYVSYGDWLRAQVRGGVDDSFERALSRASANRAPSLERFLHAFVESWSEEGDPDALAAVFGIDGIDSSILVSYLQSRFSGLAPDALPVRTVLTVPSATVTPGSDRGAVADQLEHRRVFELDVVRHTGAPGATEVADARHFLTSMPRLGP